MVNINLFAQLIQVLPKDKFKDLVNKHQTDYAHKGIDSWTHFISMIFCQLGQATSVRDISNGLRSITGNINHLGIKQVPSKSTLSYINQHRDAVLFKEFYFALLDHLSDQKVFTRSNLKRFKRKIYILDASLVSVCLSMFDWAKYRSRKGAVKLHLLLDYDGCIPAFAHITNGKVHEINIARQLQLPKGSVVVFDRGYVDFNWLADLDSNGICFVTRPKSNMNFSVKESFEIEDKQKHFIKADLDIELTGSGGAQNYTKKLRLVKVWDDEKQDFVEFLTNNFSWTAHSVAAIYKQRWRIETFFKQVKQNLHIKSFIGTSENAVMIQIWTALITMLLLTYLKEKAKYKWHLSNMITFIRLNLFAKIEMFEWLDHPFWKYENKKSNQLTLLSG